ncbi:MAG: efflux RND transporter permease subunit [Cyanobacteria bacterium P01_E01_bin.42]
MTQELERELEAESTPPTHSEPHDEAHEVKKASVLENFFFLKQIFALLLTLLLLVGGAIALGGMVKESDPEIIQAIASITTVWGGADPETIENQVTDKLETELKSLRGLDELSSASFSGLSRIQATFRVEADVSDSIARVRAAVNKAEADITDRADPPEITEISSQDTPILTIGLYGINQTVLSRVSEDIQDLLEKVPGVREVDLIGQRKEAIVVQMLPDRLLEMGIAPTQVANAIQQGNLDVPWDSIESDEIGARVGFFGRFRQLEDLLALPVARIGNLGYADNDGRVVTLDEVAEVRRDLERETNRAFLSNNSTPFEPLITLEVVKVPGSDAIRIIDLCLASLEEARNNPDIWPNGMDYRVIVSQADEIQEDLNNVASNVIQGVIGVFVVLFFALTWREAIIAGLSIPLTFLGALAILFAFGFTLNSLVQTGMILSLGLLVDVFILMMEGMHDGIYVEGLPWHKAALKTVRTYSLPAFTGQLTTIFALAPLLAISGTMGQFIRFIPITAIVCLLTSYFLALIVDIPLSYYLLGNVSGEYKATWIDKLTEVVSGRFANWTLGSTVRSKAIARLWVFAAIALFVFSFVLVSTIPGELFPKSDGRRLSINLRLPPTTTLDSSQAAADEIGEILRAKPYFENVIKQVGLKSNLVQESGIQPNEADYYVGFSAMFLPQNERRQQLSEEYKDKLSYELAGNLKLELGEVIRNYPGTTMTVNYQTTGEGGDPFQLQISGPDMDVLRQISRETQLALRNIPGATDVRDDLGPKNPEIRAIPRREAMDFYGFSSSDLADQGRFLIADTDIGDFPIGGGEEDLTIYLSTKWPSRQGAIGGPTNWSEIMRMRFVKPDGETIVGSQILDTQRGEAPISITHQDAERTVTILAKTEGGRTLGEIWGDLQPQLDRAKEDWPSGYAYKLAGEAETQAETFGSAGQMLIVSLFLIFSVLVIQFGSFLQPFIIMMSIPLAAIGTFLGFFLTRTAISFPAVIGMISLTGIVVNDAIVMVEMMNKFRDRGMPIREAAARGAAARLRPILTTSITTIVGVIPLALSDPVWFPLASAIGFGLVAATLNALIIIPCLYLLLTGPKKEVVS